MKSVDGQIAGGKRAKIRQGLMAAYHAYLLREPGSTDSLMRVVHNFAYMKVRHLEFQFKNTGSSETADDWAQEVVLKVWKGLEKFDGTPELFYSWVHKISFNEAADACNYLLNVEATKVPLFEEQEEDENGETHEEENSEIHGSPRVGFTITIPQNVQGIDLNICKLIMDGMSYVEVADALKMTENAVEHRLRKLRNRIKEEREVQRPTPQ